MIWYVTETQMVDAPCVYHPLLQFSKRGLGVNHHGHSSLICLTECPLTLTMTVLVTSTLQYLTIVTKIIIVIRTIVTTVVIVIIIIIV